MTELTLFDSLELATYDTGWEIDGLIMRPTRGHSMGEYARQFELLQAVEQGTQFWQGDLANAGKEEHGYGAIKEIAEDLGIAHRSLIDNAYVARQTMSLRNYIYPLYPHLNYMHYKIVAPMEEDEQIRWLEQAGENDWSAAQLRREIKGGDWEPRYFNHWSAFPLEGWQNTYPGQIPAGILMNVLYYTTNKGDLVIDPFGGGGNMALACGKMERECITYDIDPKYPGMIKHDAVMPFPDNGAQLVFLDPPYWEQKKGEYAEDPGDLSNSKTAEIFHLRLKAVCDNAKAALSDGGYLALIIGASQTKDLFVDHASEMYALLKDEWKHINNIAAAYPTSQYSGSDIENAKKHKYMLNLYTTVQIWQKI